MLEGTERNEGPGPRSTAREREYILESGSSRVELLSGKCWDRFRWTRDGRNRKKTRAHILYNKRT